MKSVALFLFLMLNAFALLAQDQGSAPQFPPPSTDVSDWTRMPRYEDHFWRRRVCQVIDLNEKENQHLKQGQLKLGTFYRPEDLKDKFLFPAERKNDFQYKVNGGIVTALLTAFKAKKIEGYDPKNLDASIDYDAMMKIMMGGPAPSTTPSTDPKSIESTPAETTEEGDPDEEEIPEEDAAEEDVIEASSNTESEDEALTQLKEYIEVIEDRIFDKNKSDMYYDIQYIIFTRVKEGLEDNRVVAFRYDDKVKEVLNSTIWQNKQNDAEYRSMKEILEMRNFNSWINILSGNSPSSLEDSDKKRLQMVEFEHNLWEF